MNLEKYQRLERTVAEAKRRKDQAVGAAKQLEAQLAREFGCHSLKSAKSLLVQHREQIAQQEQELEEATAKFTKKWKGFLDEHS